MPDPLPGSDHKAALLLIDLINDLDFADGPALDRWMDGVAEATERLRVAADAAGVPVIYVNDNHDRWHSDRERIIDDCRARSRRPDLIDWLRPRADDYFVIKPRFSGF